MRRFESSYKAASPCSSENQPCNPTFQFNTSSANPSYTDFIEDSSGLTETLDPLQQLLDSYGEFCDAQANTLRGYEHTSSTFDAKGSFCRASESQVQYNNNNSLTQCAANQDKALGSVCASRETKDAQHHLQHMPADSADNPDRRSYSIASQRSSVMTSLPHPTIIADSAAACGGPYSTYRGLFRSSDAARDHRHFSTRFGRQPYIDPDDDPTIEQVERHRDQEVGRIYDAMIRGDRAQDNAGSIAMKRWVHGAHYKSDLVEAFAHKVFDCLLVQVKEGFRGWHHNDYVDDDRKGEKEDREADCMGRLENIIDALEREKTICEDVVNSASQIRMFVNAPIAYAARKYQNRLGNSKRGRTKESADTNARPGKMRRGGRQTRARSTTASDIPTSRDTTPQFQAPASTATPYYSTPYSPPFQTVPTPTHLAPPPPLRRLNQSRPDEHLSTRQTTATAPPTLTRPNSSASVMPRFVMSPPTRPASQSLNTHRTMMTPAQMPLQPSPAPSTHMLHSAYHSAPPSPDDSMHSVSTINASSLNTWLAPDPFDANRCIPIDPSLSTQQSWPHGPAPFQQDGTSYHHGAATHVTLADIEHTPLQPTEPVFTDPIAEFESLWNEQPGVQHFSFDEAQCNNGFDLH